MDIDFDSDNEERREASEISLYGLPTPASSRAASPLSLIVIDQEFNQDAISAQRNLQASESFMSIDDNTHDNRIISTPNLGHDLQIIKTIDNAFEADNKNSPTNLRTTKTVSIKDNPRNSIIPVSRLGNDIIIIEIIGKGAYGVVMKVKHQIDSHFYALKYIKLRNGDEEYTLQEAKTLAELKHPNLMGYGDSWLDVYPYENILSLMNDNNNNRICSSSQMSLCILTELCESNLTHLIDKDLYKQPVRAMSIFWKIADGLCYIHEKGYIHGDLRPDNILIKKMNPNKKADCGVCLRLCYSSSHLPCSHMCCSTCVKVISIETKECAICQVQIPYGYFDSSVSSTAQEYQVFQWKYEGKKQWWSYDGQSNIALEKAFNDGNLECNMIVKNTKYRINFQHMVQMQDTDRTKTRKIRREPPISVKDYDEDDVRIGDFGLTNLVQDFEGFLTQKDDINSLGVILLEMFQYSLIDKKQCGEWNWDRELRTEKALENKDPKNAGLIYLLKHLLNEDLDARPTCLELLGPIKRGFEQMLRGRKRQAEQLHEDNTKQMRKTKLR